MSERLKTCPFCGKTPYVKIDYHRNRVKCTNASCLVQPATAYFRTMDEATDAWNRRDGEKHDD